MPIKNNHIPEPADRISLDGWWGGIRLNRLLIPNTFEISWATDTRGHTEVHTVTIVMVLVTTPDLLDYLSQRTTGDFFTEYYSRKERVVLNAKHMALTCHEQETVSFSSDKIGVTLSRLTLNSNIPLEVTTLPIPHLPEFKTFP